MKNSVKNYKIKIEQIQRYKKETSKNQKIKDFHKVLYEFEDLLKVHIQAIQENDIGINEDIMKIEPHYLCMCCFR
jgi:hypothetical protein